MSHDIYSSPLASRYASGYMLHLFSDDSRYQTWRRLWTALARAQHQLGLPIKFVGTGESIGDLTPFSAAEFAQALLLNEDEE